MDKILYLTCLYDIYSALLTEKQREIFQMYYLENLSMQEIGEEFCSSRQSVNDLLKRTEKLLMDYENKLNLFQEHKSKKNRIKDLMSFVHQLGGKYTMNQDELTKLKEMILQIDD